MSICTECIWWITGKNPPACIAFPGGIPEGILKGDIDHSQPYPGDGGYRYRSIYR